MKSIPGLWYPFAAERPTAALSRATRAAFGGSGIRSAAKYSGHESIASARPHWARSVARSHGEQRPWKASSSPTGSFASVVRKPTWKASRRA